MFRSAISFFIGVQLLIGSREASLAKFRPRLWENPRRLTRFRRIEIQVGKLRSEWKARQRKILDESAWLRQLNAFPTTSTAEVVKGFSGSKDWLQKYWRNPPVPVIFLLDLIIFVCVGGYIGTGIYDPSTTVAAFAAGVSWPVGLGALVTKPT